LKEGYTIKLCSLDIWGNKKDGYDFNDIYSKTEIKTTQDFYDYWNIKASKLFKKRILKQLNVNYSNVDYFEEIR